MIQSWKKINIEQKILDGCICIKYTPAPQKAWLE